MGFCIISGVMLQLASQSWGFGLLAQVVAARYVACRASRSTGLHLLGIFGRLAVGSLILLALDGRPARGRPAAVLWPWVLSHTHPASGWLRKRCKWTTSHSVPTSELEWLEAISLRTEHAQSIEAELRAAVAFVAAPNIIKPSSRPSTLMAACRITPEHTALKVCRRPNLDKAPESLLFIRIQHLEPYKPYTLNLEDRQPNKTGKLTLKTDNLTKQPN